MAHWAHDPHEAAATPTSSPGRDGTTAGAQGTPALTASELRIHLGSGRARREVVRGVDLDVGHGEFLALIGPNGSGKSTLLRGLAGLIPAEGVVTVPSGRPVGPREVAVMPQTPILPPGMNVAEYVLLGRTPHLGAFGRESENDRRVVDDVLDRLDLRRHEARPVIELSGGESQRVALARALAQKTPVLLLDEPTSALDIGTAAGVLGLVDDLRRRDGLTVVVAIHDLTVAARYADRLVLLEDGVVAARGSVEQVLTAETLSRVYRTPLEVHRIAGRLVVLPA
ncbi:ABC transporter ATP-binding protein [Mobilicoccus pelagius]|uniref:Putative ABC transporter ATP-binding protein n=1 Tax=Mobilicoccus pelagius NBRC 104925 TaxID=1089455 RepID=H5UNT3_9MICO|nr:ABC transporter ATP-binding protein [Mobilicoccus pelagius]GAB47391.1 putative ABC transporter ATP-binding protein [Mobilicoccus pelagius NBRC 104925]